MAERNSAKTQRRPQAAEGPSPYARYAEARSHNAAARKIHADYEPYEDDYLDEDEPEELLLDRYRVVESRATGGFGQVDICWDTRLQRRVAIKRIPLYADEDSEIITTSVEDAISEARTASMLSHPNIVTVYDFETDAHYAYLVMEYVNGLSLAELMQRVEGGILSFDECAHVLKSLSQALAFAHENGVLHLDIKPANILIDRSGTVKLGDFGMASLASAAGYGGARGGTVGYMSPEQIVGELVDERSDIFSLAVVIWQSLAHQNPFSATTAGESLNKIKHGPSPRLSKLEPELAGPVEMSLLNALSPDPYSRIASATALANRVVPELGDPTAGQSSLRQLLEQLADDENLSMAFGFERAPLTERVPWLSSALIRLACAACCGLLSWRLATPLAELVSQDRALFALGAAAITLLLPSLGVFVPPLMLMANFITSKTALAFPVQAFVLVAVVGFVALIWRMGVGFKKPLSSCALLVPSALGAPLCGITLAGFALSPVAAACTACLGWLGAQLMHLSLEHSFDVALVVDGLARLLRFPHTWIALAICTFVAVLVSVLSRRNSYRLAIFAQILGFVFVVVAHNYLLRVENAGIWSTPLWNEVGIALALSVSLSLASMVFGAPGADLEVD